MKKYIYTNIVKEINSVFGVKKTNGLAAGLFLSLPIEVEFRRLPEKVKVTKNKLALCSDTYVRHNDNSKVIYAFYYHKKSDKTKIEKMIKQKQNIYYLAYLYIRESMRVMLGHTTKTYYDNMKRHIPKIDTEEKFFYVKAASSYFINLQIKKLFDSAKLSKEIDNILEYQFYTPAYKGMTDVKILQELYKTADKDEHMDYWLPVYRVIHNDYELIHDKYDPHIVDIGETLYNTIRQNCRGIISMEIFESLIQAKKTNVGWFKKLKKAFNVRVFHKTSKFASSWEGLNTVYRSKFKSPKKIFKNNKLNVILSIDQSSSQSDEDLGKILI